jgi:hypothetical protein
VIVLSECHFLRKSLGWDESTAAGCLWDDVNTSATWAGGHKGCNECSRFQLRTASSRNDCGPRERGSWENSATIGGVG